MRKTVLSDEVREAIVVLHTKKGLVPRDISKRLQEIEVSISTSTIRTLLMEWGVYDVGVADELKYSGSRRPRSDKTKERMRQASLERWSKNDGSIGFKGRKHSPETYSYWQPFTSKGEFKLKEKLEKKGYEHGYKFAGLGFGRQGYLAIFDFYHEKWKIAVEIDGEDHFTKEHSEQDIKRDRFMLKHFGVCTIRIRESTMKVYKVTKGFGDTPDLLVERIR